MAEAVHVRQPRGPVLGWRSAVGGAAPADLPSLMQLPHRRLTTSGRAAIWQALAASSLPRGSLILVPTYHCPTLVAPVVAHGLTPAWFPIDANGLPALDGLPDSIGDRARAIIVPHYFGRVQSLAAVRHWCDERGIVLIEDCAHALFGQAGERPVGAWGDYATASLTKFLPVPEAGLLGSAHRPLPDVALRPPGLRQQVKAWVDVAERRPERGAGRLVRAALKGMRGRRPPSAVAAQAAPPVEADAGLAMLEACDMGRADERPTALASALARSLPLGRAVRRRRANFDRLADGLAGLACARPIWPGPAGHAVPYVYPLRVDDADRVYAELRQAGLAVLRWDRVWPGTPAWPGDHGADWSRHVLQLLCHQDLGSDDLDVMVDLIGSCLRAKVP